MNETVANWIKLGVTLLLVASFVVALLFVTGKGQEWFGVGSKKISRAENQLVNSEFDMYANTEVTGNQIQQAFRQFANETYFGISVTTNKSVAPFWYYKNASNPDNLSATALQISETTNEASAQYINPTATFSSKVVYDKNNKAVGLAFVQK